MRVSTSAVSTSKSNMRAAFTAAGRYVCQLNDKYGYTGWAEIDGEWVYLMPGGSVGAEGLDVKLDDNSYDSPLNHYTLGQVDGIDELEAAAMAKALQGTLPSRLMTPLLSFVYLTPLLEFLKRANAKPGFMMWLYGTYMTGKSVLARILLSFFGTFTTGCTLPGSFQDSPTSTKGKASMLKDCLYVIDDYRPLEDKMAANQKNLVEVVARMYSEGNTRTTSFADGSQRPNPPTRSMGLATGEDLPRGVPSGLSRMYAVCIHQGDILPGEKDEQAEEKREALSIVQ